MSNSKIRKSADYLREHAKVSPSIGVILGSGLGDFADALPDRTAISTSDIPHYPLSTVEGHKGRIVFASLQKTPILAFQGRIHFYEANNLDTVLYPIWVAYELGIKTLIVTNAAGGINRNYAPGDLMIISDQINLTFLASGKQSVRRKLPDSIYSAKLISTAEEAASASGIPVRKGVYIGLKGPSYETASEVEMLARLGGDAVGMSTVFETMLAASMGINVLGISCITNLGTGISTTKLSHEEVSEVGNRVKHTFAKLLSSTIERL